MNITAELKSYYVTEYDEDTACLVGRVTNDTKGHFMDDSVIRTSLIVLVVGDHVFTRNSIYKVEW